MYVLSRNKKKMKLFLSENFQFLEVKFSVYLNRQVFVMTYRSDKNKPVLKSHTGPLPIYRLVTMYYVLLCPVSYQ